MRKSWVIAALILLLGSAAVLNHLASGPDRKLAFERRVPSPLTASQLSPYLGDVTLWPDWFYSTASVHISGDPKRKQVHAGDQVEILIDPKKGKWKKFEIKAQVTRYEPGRGLSLRVLGDTKGRLKTLFDDLTWDVDLEPASTGATIVGRASGVTRSWRSRLFGVLTERILMAQVYYPNVIALSEKGAGIAPAGGGLFPN